MGCLSFCVAGRAESTLLFLQCLFSALVGTLKNCHYAIKPAILLGFMAGTTGLEPATSAVTGQRSNQLSYVPNCILPLPQAQFLS